MTTSHSYTISPTVHEQEAWIIMRPFRRPNWEESEYSFTREQLPSNTTFCFNCGRPFCTVAKHLRVTTPHNMAVPPSGGRCFACGNRKGAQETYGIVKWGQGWRVVEAHSLSFALIPSAEGEETPAVYQEETFWEDDTFLDGDGEHFSTLVRLLEQVHCGKDRAPVETAIDSLLEWIEREEEEKGSGQGLGKDVPWGYGPVMTENDRGEVVVYK